MTVYSGEWVTVLRRRGVALGHIGSPPLELQNPRAVDFCQRASGYTLIMIYNVGPNQSNRDCAAGCRRVSDGGTGAAESRPRPLCVFGPDNFVLVGLICGRSPASCAGPPVTRSLPVQTPMARLRRRPASHIRKGHLFRQIARRGSRRAVWKEKLLFFKTPQNRPRDFTKIVPDQE